MVWVSGKYRVLFQSSIVFACKNNYLLFHKKTFATVGYTGPLAVFIYFVIWCLINGPLTNPIATVIYSQDKREGDFRFKHMNLRMNAESIAFYDSSQSELNQTNQKFTSLLSNI